MRLPLLTDFYQVTMSYGYWKTRRMEMQAVFHLHFRNNPFGGGYAVAAGLENAIEFLRDLKFADDDLAFLASLNQFDKAFLDYIQKTPFALDVEAIPEGTLVFPQEPLVKVRGPIWQCQWVETALLNIINFQTLIATKAARVVSAAKGGEVLEFGLRRAQGIDGALSASRASYIGGVGATSNVLAAKQFGIPLRGTHAHSWVMSFDSEQEAFNQYALNLPEACVLLVDTYDTITGVKHAIETAKLMAAKGQRLFGIRLDSGDLAYLSAEARKMLDAAGFSDTKIVASNELDEHLIQSLHLQEAKLDSYGVGTKLVTGGDQSAMSGVYKLAAVEENGKWNYKIKVSNQPAKTLNPGLHRLKRFYNESGQMEGDLIYDESEKFEEIEKLVDPVVPHRSKRISKDWTAKELLVPIFSHGKQVYQPPPLADIRRHALEERKKLHPGHKRFENPHNYPVGLSPFLREMKERLIHAREGT